MAGARSESTNKIQPTLKARRFDICSGRKSSAMKMAAATIAFGHAKIIPSSKFEKGFMWNSFQSDNDGIHLAAESKVSNRRGGRSATSMQWIVQVSR